MQDELTQLARILRTREGQQLLELLRTADTTAAREAASAGNLEDAKRLLAPLLSDPKVRALLEAMGGKL